MPINKRYTKGIFLVGGLRPVMTTKGPDPIRYGQPPLKKRPLPDGEQVDAACKRVAEISALVAAARPT
jgi:hypothetical protein